ncbi:hypothetical protein IAT40_005300 [Kwoniella sp. CBS 6097]
MLEDMSNSLSPPKRKPKPQAENWDDDFEFSLPSASSSKKSSTGPSSSHSKNNPSSSTSKGKGKERDENIPIPVRGNSPTEDWDEDWDESPPKAKPSSTGSSSGIHSHNFPSSAARHERKKSSIPPPLTIPPPYPDNHQPRWSPSHTASLPTPSPLPLPTSSSSQLHQPLLPSRSYSSLGLAAQAESKSQIQSQPRSRSGSTTNGTNTRNKLIKRHPSASFVPIPNRSASSSYNLPSSTYFPNDSDASLSSISFMIHSSPNLPHPPVPPLPRSTSGEQMPPPPLPSEPVPESGLGLGRSRSRSKSKVGNEGKRQDVRVSGIPFSPSRNDMKEQPAKKPGFWKRLSGAPTVDREQGTPTGHRRRRSSSVGGKIQQPSSSPRPPVPPLPNNLRSPSATSSTSHSSNKSGPTSAFSALLRRSSSSLSKRSDKSREAPPSSYPHASPHARTSSSSVNSYMPQGPGVPIPSRSGDVTPDLPSSQSFSRGFHLPSPSPGSPYHPSKSRMPNTAYPGTAAVPPLPHSSSFPGPQAAQAKNSGSDTETEGESKTPKRRKKIRPASALPAPRNPSSGWGGDAWKGLGESDGGGLPHAASTNIPTPPIPGLPASRQSSLELATRPVDGTPSSGFAASTSSTLRRIGSLSKKHGRRLSGGFKFGTNSSTPSGSSSGGTRPLEPVLGSPSKPPKSEDLPLSPTSPTPLPSDEALRHAIRAGSVSAPSSVFKPMPTHPSITGLDGLTTSSEQDHGDKELNGNAVVAAAAEKKEKHRRRQSWNDFIIPREVMAKQKELKENIGAVKMFASGVTSLKTLLSTHAEMRDRILASGTAQDAAEFTSLESEFEQWLEMAVVLIEVGSTGAEVSTQPSFSSPPRSRRVTLASDEAKKASAAMMKATSAPGGPGSAIVPPVQLAGWRKTSLPDPEDASLEMSHGPPRADHPDQWRASTGRQDLSKRQLEVLRTMLRTPVTTTPGRPGLPPRAASTLSASSTTSSFLNVSPDRLSAAQTQGRAATRSRSRTPESISFPSPGDSAHVNPSASFPSPLSAARFAQPSSAPGKTLKDRRASKAGLAGLKEFLRSLKKDKPPSSSSVGGAANQGGGGGLSPIRIRTRFGMKASTSPPASPTSPLSPAFSRLGDGVFYPTQRSTFSALGSNQPPPSAPILSHNQYQSQARSPIHDRSQQLPMQTQGPFQSRSRSNRSATLAGADPASASSSPRLGTEHKRPSIRNIFRTSSGNWSELVKDSSAPGSPANEHKSNNTGSPGLSGLTKKLSAHRLGLGGGGSPKPAGGSRYGISPGGSRVSVSDPMPTRIPFSTSASTLTPTQSTSSAASDSLEESPKPAGFGFGAATGDGEMDRTLRANTRKRVSGLGLGLGWPESPVKSAATPSTTGCVDEMGTVFESPGLMDRTLRPGPNGQGARLGSYPTSASPKRKSSGGLIPGQNRGPSASSTTSAPPAPSSSFTATLKDRTISASTASTDSSSTSASHVNGIYDDNSAYMPLDDKEPKTNVIHQTLQHEEGRDGLIVALTPENLPTLLEYLRQCESKLGEWRGRARELISI